MLDVNELSKFVETTKKLMADNPLMNEPNTKGKVITPFLEMLGWDINFDVELEYPVRVGSTTAKVDYALLLERKPAVFVEAKGFDSTIGENEATQAISYGRIEGVKWAAITNGKSIHIFNTDWGKSPVDCIVAKIDINDFVDKKKTLWLLSKQSILSQEIDVAADTIRQTRNLITKLEGEKDKLSIEIANVIKRIADKSLHRRIEDVSKEVLADLIFRLNTSPKESTTVEITKTPFTSDINEINRSSIRGSLDDEVAVFPSRESGVEFLNKYRAWGYVKINRQTRYIALYVGRPYSQVLYFGEVDYITKPFESKEEIRNIEDADKDTFSPGKQVVYLKKNSLVKLSDPIPAGPKGSVPYNLHYTTLGKFKSAKTTKELWH